MARSLEIATSLLLFDPGKGNAGAIIPFYRWVNWDIKIRFLAQVTSRYLSLSSTFSLNHACLVQVGGMLVFP